MNTQQRLWRILAVIVLIVVCIGVGYSLGIATAECPSCEGRTTSETANLPTRDPGPNPERSADSDRLLGQLFSRRESDIQVSGSGTVSRVLADDEDGSRHQRFILQLDSGQTLLIAHNIDLAPRVNGISMGDRVGFNGEYVYTEQGGTIHWTHHDPDGRHEDGWLEWHGRRYA
ncbi:MAG: DUF3465 domain-containing protein [Propionibacteriaceae bacterium]|jgi:hypothetical protein|nr:DUF3465 domain-containing protein [Propionibacteriaceae bacterium]